MLNRSRGASRDDAGPRHLATGTEHAVESGTSTSSLASTASSLGGSSLMAVTKIPVLSSERPRAPFSVVVGPWENDASAGAQACVCVC